MHLLVPMPAANLKHGGSVGIEGHQMRRLPVNPPPRVIGVDRRRGGHTSTELLVGMADHPLRLAQRIGRLGHGYGVLRQTDGCSAACRYQPRTDRSACYFKRTRDRSPYCFHGRNRGCERRGVEEARERRASFWQKTLDEARELVDQRLSTATPTTL